MIKCCKLKYISLYSYGRHSAGWADDAIKQYFLANPCKVIDFTYASSLRLIKKRSYEKNR